MIGHGMSVLVGLSFGLKLQPVRMKQYSPVGPLQAITLRQVLRSLALVLTALKHCLSLRQICQAAGAMCYAALIRGLIKGVAGALFIRPV
jgi:hypothetical protein